MENGQEILEKIRQFANQAHQDQKRKYNNEAYHQHLQRVMDTCAVYTHDPCVLAAAYLHDIIEDTPVTKEDLKHFLLTVMDEVNTNRTLQLVVELTDVFIKEDYPKWNRSRR